MSGAERFLDGLRSGQAKYREMAVAAEEQRRAIEASDMDRLLEVVERKRALLAQISAIDKDLAPLREGWEALKTSVDASMAREIEATAAATRDLLRDLVRQEDEGRVALERMRQAEAVDLQALLARSKARKAYGKP